MSQPTFPISHILILFFSKILDLTNNTLGGSIPSELGGLSALQVLYLRILGFFGGFLELHF